MTPTNRRVEAGDPMGEAYAAFEAWQAEQSEEVRELDLLEQIDIYAGIRPSPSAGVGIVSGALKEGGMAKTIDENFRDWESSTFGFGYGSGEPHTVPALKRFFELCPDEGGYDYRVLETELGPVAAWLLINALARHRVDVLEYGTSPRFAWLTDRGKRLKAYMASKAADGLVEIAASRSEDDNACSPNACNCGPNGYQAGVICANPFWCDTPAALAAWNRRAPEPAKE